MCLRLKLINIQIFVANPNKPESVFNILKKNQEKLVEFLADFHKERADDEQFIEEKNFLIKQIEQLDEAEETEED